MASKVQRPAAEPVEEQTLEQAWKEFQPNGSTWMYECFKAGWSAAKGGRDELSTSSRQR